MTIRVHCKKNSDWQSQTLKALQQDGYAVVEGVLGSPELEWTRKSLYQVQKLILAEVGQTRLQAAQELGVLRLMMKYEEGFVQYLEIEEVLQIIDSTVSPSAVMHLQNGFILPSFKTHETPQVFQNQFHMDFPRVLNGYLTSINTFFAIDDFTKQNGATLVVPGSHQNMQKPDLSEFPARALPMECPAGSMIVFDSTLFHAAGTNVSGKDRLSINHQFTRSYFKQQLDYCRALGETWMSRQKPRTQQLLGWYTRMPTSLDEYYRPTEERLYRKGQG